MRLPVLFLCFAVGGCAYEARVSSTPAYDTVSSFSAKIPGRWQITTDASALNTTVRPETYSCSAHKYPLDFTSGFASSAGATLTNLVEHVEPTSEGAPAKGARGIVVVRGESIDGHIKSVEGFMSARFVAEVTITASVAVDGRNGRIFGKTLEGRGSAEGEPGVFCEGGASALRSAAEKAQKNIIRKIGEEISNSERIRGAS